MFFIAKGSANPCLTSCLSTGIDSFDLWIAASGDWQQCHDSGKAPFLDCTPVVRASCWLRTNSFFDLGHMSSAFGEQHHRQTAGLSQVLV